MVASLLEGWPAVAKFEPRQIVAEPGMMGGREGVGFVEAGGGDLDRADT
jgi:hypothetical protein